MATANKSLTRHRRARFFKLMAVYLGGAWVLLQVAALIEETLDLPDWVDKGAFGLLLIGFPVAALFTWGYVLRENGSAEAAEIADDKLAASADQAKPKSGPPAIAVLPFVNMSEDKDKEYFADGITEDLIGGLSQSKHLLVTARSSSFSYKNTSPDIRKVGHDLGVSYVVEGSVRPVGDRIRVSVQLIEAATGIHLWAKKFDQPAERLFDVQDEMINSITAALGAQLTSAEAERAAKLKASDLTSWEAIQKSLRAITSSYITKEEVDLSVERLERAVAKNPEHKYARAGLAWFLILRVVNFCSEDIARDFEKSNEHLARAKSMMGDDPFALMLVGNTLAFGGEFQQGKDILERAMRLNPGSTDPYPGYGVAQGYLKDFSGAHATFVKARSLSPEGGFAVNFDWFDALVFGLENKFDEAMPGFLKAAAIQPLFPTVHIWLALGYATSGDVRAARSAIGNAIKASPLLTLDYLKLISILHPDPEEHQRRVGLIEPFWPGAPTA